MGNDERIVCAAILVNDEQMICGLRHGDCIKAAKYFNLPRSATNIDKQGFLTTKNRFVSRKDALKIAINAGQVNREKDILFSEDLY